MPRSRNKIRTFLTTVVEEISSPVTYSKCPRCRAELPPTYFRGYVGEFEGWCVLCMWEHTMPRSPLAFDPDDVPASNERKCPDCRRNYKYCSHNFDIRGIFKTFLPADGQLRCRNCLSRIIRADFRRLQSVREQLASERDHIAQLQSCGKTAEVEAILDGQEQARIEQEIKDIDIARERSLDALAADAGMTRQEFDESIRQLDKDK